MDFLVDNQNVTMEMSPVCKLVHTKAGVVSYRDWIRMVYTVLWYVV